MAKTAQEFIQSSFSPIIATLCSPKVENVVSKNNLTLPELLQPFTELDWEGQFRDPGGNACTVKNFNLVIRDVNWKPLQPTDARRQLNNAVLHNYDEKNVPINIGGHKIDIPQATPWFDAWRETYLEVQFPSDHEFTKHFLACIIVATTLDDNIVDVYNSLNQQYAQLQNVAPPKLPKWFNSSVLKSYLLLHDVSAVPKENADKAFDTLKQTFGASNCFMLSINSKQPSDPKLPTDFWNHYLKRPTDLQSDSQSISAFSMTPLDSQVGFQPANVTTPEISDEKQNAPSTVNTDGGHPLTAENDVYDNANSLQPYSFSGSSESVNVYGKQYDSMSEIHGAALNMKDIEAIKTFLQEYVSKALILHLEKLIAQLSEVVANKKGVSRSLLSATKRWFTTGKSGNTAVNNTVIYSSDCPELQLRRLGDVYFMCGQWQRAFDAYHTAKREFYTDSAWLCYAGALEMAAISAFMAGDASRKTAAYMEESIVTYLNTCRMVQYAVRATLLSVPCLINAGLYGEAAKQLIRMTSEDSDLRSAMLLEQAALCFLKGPSNKVMSRKYAFHMVLAGHRFSKAGQKKHAYRCYKQAYQVYKDSGWRLSTDHVQFALGRLAGALRAPRDAAAWLRAPLAPAPRAPQPAAMQDAFLREFMLAHQVYWLQQWVETSEEFTERLPVLPVPLLCIEDTAVLCVGPAPLSSPGRTPATSLSLPPPDTTEDDPYWHKMEEILLQIAQGSVPMIFKPTTDLYTRKTDANPIVSQGEPIQISITLFNPLKVKLLLKDVELLWQFTPSEGDAETPSDEILINEPSLASGTSLENNIIIGQKIKSILLDGDGRKALNFTITPLKIGQLIVQGLAFKLINMGEGKENENGVAILGKLNLQSGTTNSDKLLNITVIPETPCIQMTLSEVSADVISGEILKVDLDFRNVGPVPMKNLYIAVSHPDCMSVVSAIDNKDDFKVLYEEKYFEPPDYSDERAARAAARARGAARRVARVGAGAALLLRPQARAPRLYLLAYYETGQRARPHRLLRHVFRFNPTESIEIVATPRRGMKVVGENVLENMHLSVEVKNICNEKEDDISVEMLETSLLSRQWKLTDLTSALQTNNSLISREKVHFILKSVRIIDTLPEGHIEYSCLKLAPHLAESKLNIDGPPYSKFVTDEISSLFDTPDPVYDIEKKTGLIQSMFVLRWKAYNKKSGRTSIGQSCLWLDCFTKTISRYREKLLMDLPHAIQIDDAVDSRLDVHENKGKTEKNNFIIFRLEHSNYIDHNFKINKLCMIPVVINIVNCYGSPVSVFIEISKQKNRETSGELGWAGALSNGLDLDSKEIGLNVTLDKFESRRFQVRALCAAPGTYLVGSAFSITTICDMDKKATTQFPNSTSLLIVKQI